MSGRVFRVTRGVTISLVKGVTGSVTSLSMIHALTKFRKERDLSKAELARLAKTTRQTIHRIEARDQTPSMDLVRRLVDATDEVLSANDFMPPRPVKRSTRVAA